MKAWKNAEKRIAELLHGKRIVRASFSDRRPDVIAEMGGFRFVVEVKHRRSLPKFLTRALDQAKRFAGKNTIYIAYFHEKNAKRGIIAIEDIHFKEILESKLVKDTQEVISWEKS